METYFLDWANLLLRWVHVITAIAWVGSSFYFVFLDNNLVRPNSPDLLEKGVDGAMWAVHGGGFYNPQKYMVAPKKIHTPLHWFYWESYSTWLSGFALFTVLYLWNAGTFLIDQSLFAWSPVAAGATAVGLLVAFWFVYDAISRIFGFRENGEAWVGGLMFIVVAFSCWLTCQLFAGRAAFLIVGAMIATAMSANVFFWIIPGQRKVVAAMTSGKTYDPMEMAIHGKRGKQRSVHNTYFTLPVLFAMLSNHNSFLYTHEKHDDAGRRPHSTVFCTAPRLEPPACGQPLAVCRSRGGHHHRCGGVAAPSTRSSPQRRPRRGHFGPSANHRCPALCDLPRRTSTNEKHPLGQRRHPASTRAKRLPTSGRHPSNADEQRHRHHRSRTRHHWAMVSGGG